MQPPLPLLPVYYLVLVIVEKIIYKKKGWDFPPRVLAFFLRLCETLLVIDRKDGHSCHGK